MAQERESQGREARERETNEREPQAREPQERVARAGEVSSSGLEGRIALITGASSGLGRHFADVLARAGASVVLAARRMELLEQAADKIERAGGKALATEMDVTEPESVARAFAAAEAQLGVPDIVIANAGVAEPRWFTRLSAEDWRRTLSVNLDGVFHVGQAAAAAMKAANKGGSIINIASVLGFVVQPMLSAYAVSKAGVIQLTRAMALELARDGIRVNAIAPGYFPTDMNRRFLESELGHAMLARFPMARAGALGELDGALLLLASDASSYMTGSVITVDGGAALAVG